MTILQDREERLQEVNEAIEKVFEQYKEGLLTKKEYLTGAILEVEIAVSQIEQKFKEEHETLSDVELARKFILLTRRLERFQENIIIPGLRD